MYNTLYINGDSYSADVDNISVYGQVLAKTFNVNYINKAIPGSSNDRIFRTTIEDCLKLKSYNQNFFALIGLSFITREEVWAPETSDLSIVSKFDSSGSCKLVTRDFLSRSELSAYRLQSLVDEDINTQFAHFFYKLFMFTSTLENLQIPYFIFSAATNVKSMSNLGYILGTESYQSLAKRKNIVDIFDLSIPSWAKQNNITTTPTGQLKDTDSHSKFAKYLYTEYLSSIWD